MPKRVIKYFDLPKDRNKSSIIFLVYYIKGADEEEVEDELELGLEEGIQIKNQSLLHSDHHHHNLDNRNEEQLKLKV